MTLNKSDSPTFLRPGMHRVVVEVAPGQWQIVGDTGQDLELLQIDVATQHAIAMQSQNVMIVDEESKPVTKFENYKPAPQPAGEPITDENLRIRNRWVANVLLWAIPRELRDAPATGENKHAVQQALINAGVKLSISPDGTAAIIERNGETLATWYC